MNGWVVDKSVVARVGSATVRRQLERLAPHLYLCGVSILEQGYSARSAADYDALMERIGDDFLTVDSPADLLVRAQRLQRDLAHAHGMWHRVPIGDLLIAETALFHDLGVLHADADFDRIAKVRPLRTKRIRA